MKIQNYRNVTGMTAAPGVTMRVVSGPAEKAPTFVMRVFEIEPGSATPYHAHPWEHEVYVLGGKGAVKSDGKDTPLREGDAVTVLPGEQHSFMNAGKEMLRIICVVPLVNGKMPGMPAQD
ncbi:MAG: cupin domain-containing protein [Dehalococcoidales bacterium]|jgi:quercetin dioxygenase-like cupin family protein